MTAVVLAWPRHLRANCPDQGEPPWQCLAGICVHVNLFCCRTCGGAEGSLPTDCPGERMDSSAQDAIYAGDLNFIAGHGWVRPGQHNWRRSW